MNNTTEDKLFATRLIERFGDHAAVQTRLRIQELEQFGQTEVASQWRRALILIEFESQEPHLRLD